jgi:PleD family two-component response regulator
MTQMLALVLYEKLLPGSQIVNRLQDMNYRVQVLPEASRLVACAAEIRPLLVLADLSSSGQAVCTAIAELRQNPATRHLPVIAFSNDGAGELSAAAGAAGATLVVSDAAILNHLSECLERALEV